MPNPLSGKEALNKEFLNVLIRMLLCQVAEKCVEIHFFIQAFFAAFMSILSLDTPNPRVIYRSQD